MVLGKYCLGGWGEVLGGGGVLILDLDADSMVVKTYTCTSLYALIKLNPPPR